MNINYIVISIISFLTIFGIYGYYSNYTKNKIINKEKEFKLNKYGKVVKPFISDELQDPYVTNFKELNETEIQQINNLWHECFPDLKYYSAADRGFSGNTIIWLLKEINSNKIQGYICVLESLELIQFLNSKGIEDTDLYSIKNWNGGFINNLCISTKYRKNGWGNRLIQEVVNWAFDNKKDYLHLLIDSDNKAALNLYKKNKFLIDKESMNSDTNKEVFTMVRLINSNKLNDDTDLDLDNNYHTIL